GDKVAVEQRGDGFVFERLALHDVAPMARGVADGKEDGLVFPTGFFEGVRPPRKPVHRIVSVLQQVRTLLTGKSVGMHIPLSGLGPGPVLSWYTPPRYNRPGSQHELLPAAPGRFSGGAEDLP